MAVARRTLLGSALSLAAVQARAQAAPLVVNTYGGRWTTFWREQLVPKLQATLGNPGPHRDRAGCRLGGRVPAPPAAMPRPSRA